jgi:replicative DNA helicase
MPSGHAPSSLPVKSDVERSLLAGIFFSPETLTEIARWEPHQLFFSEVNRCVYKEARDLYAKKKPVDIVSVSHALEEAGVLERIGGSEALMELTAATPPPSAVSHYAEILIDLAERRRVIATAGRIAEAAREGDLDGLREDIEHLSTGAIRKGEIQITTARDAIIDAIRYMKKARESKDGIQGLRSGWDDIDDRTNGFEPGDMTVIAGRPSMGKSAMANELAYNIKEPVMFASVEMRPERLALRRLSNVSGVPMKHLRTGMQYWKGPKPSHSDVDIIQQSQVYYMYSPSTGPDDIREALTQTPGIKAVIIDYLQLMSSQRRFNSANDKIAYFSRELKSIAMQFKVHIFALSQLNRGVESRVDKRPLMSDLRESGAIEQDADIVMLLYRDDYYDKSEKAERNILEVNIAKVRDGETGMAKLVFDREKMKISSYQGSMYD